MIKGKKMSPALKRELWNLLVWVGLLKGVKIIGIECTSCSCSLSLINNRAHFEDEFEIDDIETIKGLSRLCCLWANKGIGATKDYNGKSIFDIPLNRINAG